jgi:microcystin-dependent protein
MTIFGSGHQVVTSTTRPASPIVGQVIFETDTLSYRWYNGTAWEGVTPIGTIQPFAAATAPSGWEFCDGAALNSVANPKYAALFAAIGVTYGGSGASSFNVPNLAGRTPVGAGTGAQQGVAGSGVITGGTALTARARGQFFGDERLQGHTHTFSGTTGNDSPDHTHSTQTFVIAGGGGSNFVGGPNWNLSSGTGGANNRHQHAFSGTTANHNQSLGLQQNLQPSIVTNYIIKI